MMFNFSKKTKPRCQEIYRHGDLLIRRINAIPQSAVNIPSKVIAKGEVSGHMHKLIGQATVRVLEGSENGTADTIMKRVRNGSINIFPELYFSAQEDIELVHEEHKTLELPRGSYKVTKEREFNPFEDLETGVID